MSFQYSTKTIEELQSIARVITDNFSELVGCETTSKLWSPPTAGMVCNALLLAGSNCSNIADQYDTTDGILSYKFTSVTNSYMKDIWVKVVNFDTSVYNLDKLLKAKISPKLPIKNRLKEYTEQSTEYDSPLMTAIQHNKDLMYSEDYKRLMWIMLACFSIRYAIYDFAYGSSESINIESLTNSFLDKVVENIKYEKFALSKYDTELGIYEYSSEFMSQQLSTLLKNCKQLQAYVLAYLK